MLKDKLFIRNPQLTFTNLRFNFSHYRFKNISRVKNVFQTAQRLTVIYRALALSTKTVCVCLFACSLTKLIKCKTVQKRSIWLPHKVNTDNTLVNREWNIWALVEIKCSRIKVMVCWFHHKPAKVSTQRQDRSSMLNRSLLPIVFKVNNVYHLVKSWKVPKKAVAMLPDAIAHLPLVSHILEYTVNLIHKLKSFCRTQTNCFESRIFCTQTHTLTSFQSKTAHLLFHYVVKTSIIRLPQIVCGHVWLHCLWKAMSLVVLA